LVLGFATEQGSATAHTAILARALGLPAVVGIAGLLDRVADAEPLLLDGDGGRLVIDPPADELAAVRAPLGLQTDSAPAVSRSGRRIEVGCNVASLDDAMRAAAAGADGIGLLRSEFVFLQGSEVPTEDEQVAILEPMVAAMGERPVILRTLDVGADKPLPSLPQPAEMNPALGVRGLRLALLRRPDLLTTQIRAALRIAAHHPLRLMVPMVSTVDEVRAVKQMLIEAGEQLGLDPAIMPLGIMVEVPSAAVTAERLASEVEFFSLGTNDLTQYLFAADRTNPELAALADSLHPALLRVIDQVVQAAHRQRRWVGVCGEMASDVEAVPLLVGMGIDELSVHPPQVARVKARVRELRIDACRRLVDAAMELDRPAQVRELIRQSAA
jgi:phosphoenolpyruvate-protein phosphotransferase